MSDSVWRLPMSGTNLAVLADCHVREGGRQFAQALFPRLQGADLIVTLGDMGDRSGLDRLEAIAPVMGVTGRDDEDDPRTRGARLVLTGDGYRIGCVHDAVSAGLASLADPFVEADRAAEISRRLCGGPVDILLHAGTGGQATPASVKRDRRSIPAAPYSRRWGLRRRFRASK